MHVSSNLQIISSQCKKTKVADKKIPILRPAKTEKAEFTAVNEHFSGEHNEKSGVFLQALSISF